MLTLASASGNAFAYAWAPFDRASEWARILCPRLGLDGLFVLQPPAGDGSPWVLEHWDADGGATFCSNGTRAALAVEGAPGGDLVAARSNGEDVLLRRHGGEVGIRMPDGPGTGFRDLPPALAEAAGPGHAFGWIGNPQLVLERRGVAGLDLPALARPLRHHPALPGGTNVNAVEILAPGQARIRSFERGVEGETRCCGTGCAVAGAWLASRTGIPVWRLETLDDPVQVAVRLEGPHWRDLWLSGPVRVLGTHAPDPALLS